MNITAYMEEKRQQVDAFLEGALPPADLFPSKIYEAMRYSLFAGGKRVRPVLALAAAEAVGGNSERAMAVAAAFELVHTYSLVHDDLPAMDNDDFRRGKPTNHKVYGEAIAILAGDGLLTLAFDILSDGRFISDIPAAKLPAIINLVAKASGVSGMVGGQAADILFEGQEVDFATLEFIHVHKTGALIRASVVAGGMAAGANPEQVEALSHYGKEIGLAFQIADDILDVEGTREEMGKNVGGDSGKGKNTYPAFFGIEESRNRAAAALDRALKAIEHFDEKAEPLRDLARFIVLRRH